MRKDNPVVFTGCLYFILTAAVCVLHEPSSGYMWFEDTNHGGVLLRFYSCTNQAAVLLPGAKDLVLRIDEWVLSGL